MSRQSHCAGLQLCGNRHGALPSTMASQVTVLPRSSDEFARIEYLLQVRSLPLDKIIAVLYAYWRWPRAVGVWGSVAAQPRVCLKAL